MRLYWLWFATRKISTREKMAVLARFGEPDKIFFASEEDYRTLEELSDGAVESLSDKDLEAARAISDGCAREGIGILTFQDAGYPQRLKSLEDPPLVLYYKGTLPEFSHCPVIGIVGTRKASGSGLRTARRIARQVAACGGLVVSGMAEGIDGEATWGALGAQRPAVGVLGSGVDLTFPACNKKLYEQMERFGCLLSEYVPGTPPYRGNFPRRNRIISGLSDCVLVVEAPGKSGALQTARHAREHGREVCAVPGNVEQPSCAGSNALLADGARIVTDGWSLISEYQARYPHSVRFVPISEEAQTLRPEEKPTEKPAAAERLSEEKPASPRIPWETIRAGRSETELVILEQLRSGPQKLDDLMANLSIPQGELLGALTMLGVEGAVKELPGRILTLQ